jgi:uncharacterized membrane protein YdjX (TVP38/TMEM64 family)
MRWRRPLALAALLAVVTTCLIWLPLAEALALGVEWIRAYRGLAWLLFVAAYVVATVLVMPGSILTLAAGFVFGLPLGVVLVSAGSTLGATAAFLIGRYLARNWIERRLERHEVFQALDRATRRSGFAIVILARLSPLFPFNLLNYGLALTAVRLEHYVLASWMGMLPATVLYVYIGTGANDLTQITGGEVQTGAAGRVLVLGGLAATAVLTVLIARRATAVLRRRLKPESPGGLP